VVTINKLNDASPNSLRDPNVGFKTKQQRKKKVETHSLIRNILKVKGHLGVSKWDQDKLTSKSLK
jgi:hypothetical protein